MLCDNDFRENFGKLQAGDVIEAYERVVSVCIKREGASVELPLYPSEFFHGPESAATVLEDFVRPLLEIYAGLTLRLEAVYDKEGNSLDVKDIWWHTAATWDELNEDRRELLYKICRYKFVVEALVPPYYNH